MEITTEISQQLIFEENEFKHLRNVSASFYNGKMTSLRFRVAGTDHTIEIRDLDSLKEIGILAKRVEEISLENKKEVELTKEKSKSRLIRSLV